MLIKAKLTFIILKRLHVDKSGGAWCPKQQIAENVNEYLQIDLGNVTVISGIATQGRYGGGRGQEYAEQFRLEYYRPELSQWRSYRRWNGNEVRTEASTIFAQSITVTRTSRLNGSVSQVNNLDKFDQAAKPSAYPLVVSNQKGFFSSVHFNISLYCTLNQASPLYNAISIHWLFSSHPSLQITLLSSERKPFAQKPIF